MKHLTAEQITEFVSMTEMDADSLKLAAEVTTHIRTCQTCLSRVRAYQQVRDGFALHSSLQRQTERNGIRRKPEETDLTHPEIDS